MAGKAWRQEPEETVSIPKKQNKKNVGRFKTSKPTSGDVLLPVWLHLLNFPQLSQIVSRGEDHMHKHIHLWRTFCIQTTKAAPAR